MATARETFDFPTLYINEYLYSIISQYDDINMSRNLNVPNYIPFLPAGVTSDLDAFYRGLSTASGFEGELPATIFYDRLIRIRNSPFYVGKKEQALYTIYARASDAHSIGLIISQVLDREDAAAQDLNKWIHENREYLISKGFPMKIFFKSMRVFQIDESRDLLELQSFKAGTMHKYVVEYDYHLKDNPDFL